MSTKSECVDGLFLVRQFVLARRQKQWDENPEEFEQFLKANPTYDAAEQDDSEYGRAIMPKEQE